MSSSHSALFAGTPSGIGAIDAGCFARGASDAGLVGRRRMSPASQRGIRLNGQGQADSRLRSALSRALRLLRGVVDEGRAAMRGIPTAPPAPSSLEGALSSLM